MNLSTLFLLLQRQFIHKWGRFVLASAGIMIGVWAITLTTSLSLGLSQTIIDAINSQPAARVINVGKTANGATDIFSLSGPPEYVGLSKKDAADIKALNPHIIEIAVNTTAANNFLNMAVNTKPTNTQTCFDLYTKKSQVTTQNIPEVNKDASLATIQLPAQEGENAENIVNSFNEIQTQYADQCAELNFIDFSWNNFYQTYKADWIGSTQKPQAEEMALCFYCNEIGKKLGFSSPQDMLGKKITLEYITSPVNYKPQEKIDLLNSSFGVQQIKESKQISFTITSVIDDTTSQGGFGSGAAFIDESYYETALKLYDPTLNENSIGYITYDIFIDDVQYVEEVFSSLKKASLFAFSPIQIFIQGVRIFFVIFTWFLSGFGIIALIASVFGIVNVMTISVLERKKEIGILKSLGARNGDILRIFLIESSSLGVLGWIVGTLVAYGFGVVISLVFTAVVNANPSWKENLEGIGITSFAAEFPWWLLLATFLLAVFATAASGLFPAMKASRQNPVEVLRGE